MITLIFSLFILTSLLIFCFYHNIILGLLVFASSFFIWVDLYFEEDLKLLIPIKKYEKKH